MEKEPFGIAIAEMVRGGCIVFIPNNGGQAEIIGPENRLLFSSNSGAVCKIIDVLKHSRFQQQLRHYLESRQNLFSEDRFMDQIQRILEQAFHRNR